MDRRIMEATEESIVPRLTQGAWKVIILSTVQYFTGGVLC